ncbi:MAG: glycosyltransferase family 2 protein [Bacteroidaceae bacterium]|nr:glycosyltransferase family 2 protein [Bacteroidaceae bacterium]
MEALSILIPVFNWDCSQLIKDLHFQGLVLGIPYEIIVADDCSTDKELQEKSRIIAESHENCRYFGLPHNIGRAAIRNFLADQSRYDKLLFLDCDAAVKDKQFLKNYMEVADKASVICGGITHPDEIPQKGWELRYLYEKNAAFERSAGFRSQNPYLRFTSFSFMIDRDVFMKIRFDESYVRYGYEDVQFGHELEQNGVSILHIDNPMAHLGLEDNAAFLNKTRQAVLNAFDHKNEIGESSKLLNHYHRVLKWKMRWLFRVIWTFFQKSMERNLLGPKPKLRIFSLYKLCYICLL